MSSLTSKISLSMSGITMNESRELCKRADSLGFSGYWFSEVNSWDALTQIASVAKETNRIRLGTSIIGIYGRSPLTIAMSCASLAELTCGRFLLGLGTQAENYVTGWHGVEFKSPRTRMREYIQAIRKILSGEPVSYNGKVVRVEDFQLHPKSEYPIKILMAAIGPKMIELAGEVADGVIGNFWSAEYITKTVIPSVRKGADRANRDPKDFEIICGYSSFPGSISQLSATKPQVVMFATVPYYSKIFEDSGFSKQHAMINEFMKAGNVNNALGVVTDEMMHKLTIAGDRSEFQSKINQLLKAGLTEVMIHPVVSNAFHPLFPRHLPSDISKYNGPAYLSMYETCEKTIETLVGQ